MNFIFKDMPEVLLEYSDLRVDIERALSEGDVKTSEGLAYWLTYFAFSDYLDETLEYDKNHDRPLFDDMYDRLTESFCFNYEGSHWDEELYEELLHYTKTSLYPVISNTLNDSCTEESIITYLEKTYNVKCFAGKVFPDPQYLGRGFLLLTDDDWAAIPSNWEDLLSETMHELEFYPDEDGDDHE